MPEIQGVIASARPPSSPITFSSCCSPCFLFLTTLLGNLPIPNRLDRMMEVLAQVQSGDALRLI